jgi:glycosyltransferase involved in cell wall biosynthesis
VHPRVSVVIPVYNGEATIADCLRGLASQALAKADYDVLVVDDGSTDGTVQIAERCGARVLRQPNRGAPAARNTGIRTARGKWVAFTDADCVPSRTWLSALVESAERSRNGAPAFGSAGKMIGFGSDSPAARFVDLSGGLDSERYLQHPTFPFAPSGNLMYRRDALEAVGGFDERYATYDACDLHTRLRHRVGGPFYFEPRAVVLHRHRTGWPQYWRQQRSYGVGYAQFMLKHRGAVAWTLLDELRMLGRLTWFGIAACMPGRSDAALMRRGALMRNLAQHIGFAQTYWNRAERDRWRG